MKKKRICNIIAIPKKPHQLTLTFDTVINFTETASKRVLPILLYKNTTQE